VLRKRGGASSADPWGDVTRESVVTGVASPVVTQSRLGTRGINNIWFVGLDSVFVVALLSFKLGKAG
jgi:hypothetical protein